MGFKAKVALITGGGSGIGAGLAAELQKQGTQVIISGRRSESLEKVCAANPGMQHYELDVTDRQQIKKAAKELTEKYPDLDCLINNAGVQKEYNLIDGELPLDYCDTEIDSNFRAPIAMVTAFLPHLMRQPAATIVDVSSSLAFVVMARCPVYCATKAAIRSYTIALRHQLRSTNVRVIELIPPAVQTELHDYMGAKGREVGMPLDKCIEEMIEGLNIGHEEVVVGQAKQMKDVSKAKENFELFNPTK